MQASCGTPGRGVISSLHYLSDTMVLNIEGMGLLLIRDLVKTVTHSGRNVVGSFNDELLDICQLLYKVNFRSNDANCGDGITMYIKYGCGYARHSQIGFMGAGKYPVPPDLLQSLT